MGGGLSVPGIYTIRVEKGLKLSQIKLKLGFWLIKVITFSFHCLVFLLHLIC